MSTPAWLEVINTLHDSTESRIRSFTELNESERAGHYLVNNTDLSSDEVESGLTYLKDSGLVTETKDRIIITPEGFKTVHGRRLQNRLNLSNYAVFVFTGFLAFTSIASTLAEIGLNQNWTNSHILAIGGTPMVLFIIITVYILYRQNQG